MKLHPCSRCSPDPDPGKFSLPRGMTRHRGLCGACRDELRRAQELAREAGVPEPTTLGPYVAPSQRPSYAGRGA